MVEAAVKSQREMAASLAEDFVRVFADGLEEDDRLHHAKLVASAFVSEVNGYEEMRTKAKGLGQEGA